jgi:hypothetical protein
MILKSEFVNGGGVREHPRGRREKERGGGGPVRVAPHGGRVEGPGVRQLRESDGGRSLSGNVRRLVETGERAARVGCTREHGPAGRRKTGRARRNRRVFDIFE